MSLATKSSVQKPDLLSGDVFLTLKEMTIPMIYGMVLLMTFNLIDTFFVSLLGTQPLAAISFTFPITFTVISLFIGLGIGTSAVLSKLLGKGDVALAKCYATSALYLSSIIVLVLAFLGYCFNEQIFTLLGAEPELIPLILQYMDIWFIGCITLMGPMVGNAILRASGDTKTPSIIMGSAGLINALLDPILIFGFGPIPALGMQGAAIATLISWFCGTGLALYILAHHKKLIHTQLPSVERFIIASKSILKIGLPAAGANMLTPVASAILTAIAAGFGNAAVAAFGVGTRIESIACLVVLAMSMTLPAFIGQNFGAGNMTRVKEAYLTAIKFVLGWQIAIYILLIIFAPYIAAAFADEVEVKQAIELFLWVLPLAYGLQGVIILTNSSLNALHKPLSALVLSIIRLFVCYVPLAYIGSLSFGLSGFFIGAALGNVIMSAISFRFFISQFPFDDFVVARS